MGFQKPNLGPAYSSIRSTLIEISSPYNDGFTAASCKYELYRLKCFLNDFYDRLPVFQGEDQWEQQRLIEMLKKE